MNKKTFHSLYFFDSVYGISIEIILKLCGSLYSNAILQNRFRIRFISANILVVEKFKEAYLFFKSTSMTLHYKSMSIFFISWKYKKSFSSIFSIFLYTWLACKFENKFLQTWYFVADKNTIAFFTTKLMPLKYFGF